MLRAGQLEAICEILCRRARSPELFSRAGGWVKGVDKKLGKLSSSQVGLVELALSLWNTRNECRLNEMLRSFDETNLTLLGMLLCALAGGEKAVDRWISGTAAFMEDVALEREVDLHRLNQSLGARGPEGGTSDPGGDSDARRLAAGPGAFPSGGGS